MNAPRIGLVIGLWYLVAPFVWRYPFGFLWWHSLMIGAVLIAVSVSAQIGGGRLPGWLVMGVALYSMLSPFIHGYLELAQPLWNDLVIGVVTMATGVAMAAAALEYKGDAVEGGPAGERSPA
jgi:hypothetical protein